MKMNDQNNIFKKAKEARSGTNRRKQNKVTKGVDNNNRKNDTSISSGDALVFDKRQEQPPI